MKLLKTYNLTKTITYRGLSLQVPVDTRWIATDHCGDVYAYNETPFIKEARGYYAAYTDNTLICEVDLEGEDWTETLEEIE